MWPYVYIATFLLSATLSFLLTPLSGKIARRCNVISIPSERSVHIHPVPLLGGLGIYFSIFITILAGIYIVNSSFFPASLSQYIPGIRSTMGKLFAILSGGAIVVAFGVIDDIKILRAREKLFLQIIAAIIIFSAGIRISLTGPLYSFLLTIFWLVLMMNTFNLMDNMDGLSGGVAFISGLILFIFALRMGQLFVATLLALFLGSITGFLKHNFPPAKIFMGECGSAFLGYFLGTVSILLTFYKYDEHQTFLPLFAPLVVFSVLFFDTLSVIWIRRKRGLPIFQADRNHLSHRLVDLGMTNKQAVLFIYLLTICTGIGALLLGSLNIFGGLLILLQVVIILTIVGILEMTGRNKGRDKNGKTGMD
ncbi:MAG: undecaprenyl/decaprenyl-phosphate alpha-N-acetylglucosaminyl 1-phosphate transferase [Candidatus Omnitrophica bacterium]|nr:undecaprenyl/decaprenyl-phosphate alpha-N-acetylglucosaminyl 1-phosphate transferase [Candidatus Omnitrophota bacterium]